MRSIQICSRRSTFISMSITALACTAPLSLTGCPGGEHEEEPPEALVSLSGEVAQSALTAEEAPRADGLEAYLFWVGDAAVIDHAAISGALGSSFSLSVYEEPAASSFHPDYPDLAAAQVVAMTPETAAEFMALIAAQQNGEEVRQLAPGTVLGLTNHWLVFSRRDDAGDDVLLRGLKAGFNLIGPDPVAIACVDEAFIGYDACMEQAYSQCESFIAGDNPDFDAHYACTDGLCAGELEAVDACGSTMGIVPLETQIELNIDVVPDYSEEVTVEEN